MLIIPEKSDWSLANIRRLDNRLLELEGAVDRLIENHQHLIMALSSSDSAKRKEMPSPNTKYFEFLAYIKDTFGASRFTSKDFPEQSRHMLSILSKDYASLDIVSREGRTNIYIINPQVLEKIEEKK